MAEGLRRLFSANAARSGGRFEPHGRQHIRQRTSIGRPTLSLGSGQHTSCSRIGRDIGQGAIGRAAALRRHPAGRRRRRSLRQTVDVELEAFGPIVDEGDAAAARHVGNRDRSAWLVHRAGLQDLHLIAKRKPPGSVLARTSGLSDPRALTSPEAARFDSRRHRALPRHPRLRQRTRRPTILLRAGVHCPVQLAGFGRERRSRQGFVSRSGRHPSGSAFHP